MDQTRASIYSEEEMPRYCAAPLCNNSSLNGDPSLHLFKFPLKNEELLSKWMANTRRDQFFPNENSYLCSEHFEPSDIIHTFGRTTLKPDAIPTVFKFSTMPTCYVPGCRSGYVVNGKVDPERHFFPPPKNHDKLENWNRAIRRIDKRLDNNCRVCDLHFEDYFIEKYFTLLSNGEIKKHEPGKWTLHPDAIPTKLLPPRKPPSTEKKSTNIPSTEKTEIPQDIPPTEKTMGVECVATTVSTILLLDSSGKVSSVENIQIPQYLSSIGNLPLEGNQCSAADTIIILDSPADISSLEGSKTLQCLPSAEQLPTEEGGCSVMGDTVILLDNSPEVSAIENSKSANDLPPAENLPVEKRDCNAVPDIIAIPDSPVKADSSEKVSLDSLVKDDSPVKTPLDNPVNPAKTDNSMRASLGSPANAESPLKGSLYNLAKEPTICNTAEVSLSGKPKSRKRLPSVEELPLDESSDQHNTTTGDFTDKEASALRELLENRLAAAKAKDVDTSLMTLEFGNKRIEWVYRGSSRHTSFPGKTDDRDEIRPRKKICHVPSNREDSASIKFSRLSDDTMISYGSDEYISKMKMTPKHRTVSVQTDDFFRPQLAKKHTGGISLNNENRNLLPVIPKAKKRFKTPETLPYSVITPKYFPQIAKKQTGGKPVRTAESGSDKKLDNYTSKEKVESKHPSVTSQINVARKHTGGKILAKTSEVVGLAKKSTTLSLLEQMKKNIENNKLQTEKEDETKMIPGVLMQSNRPVHKCGRACSRIKDDDPIKYRGKNPLQIPRLCGWKRHVEKKIVTYSAPCGRIFRNIDEISRYLWTVKSKLTIDLFCFDSEVYMANEFIPKNVLAYIPDVTFGKENVPVSCVNSINEEYPPDIKYSSIRYPGKGVTLNLDPEFLCGCDCKDNCQNSKRCQCQQLTINATEALPSGKIPNAGYKYRRLVEPLLTGIYECNSRCKCGPSCMNRVAQNGLQVRLQLFYTGKKGWGIRCLDDIPKGMFICTYAGELLTEQGASEEDRQLQDDYLAELDHIEVVEKLKDGYESDVLDPDDESEEEGDKVKNIVAEDVKLDSDGLSTDIKPESKESDVPSVKEEHSEDKIIQSPSDIQCLDAATRSGVGVGDLQTATEDFLRQNHLSTTDITESTTVESSPTDIDTAKSTEEPALTTVTLEDSQCLPTSSVSGHLDSVESDIEIKMSSFSLPSPLENSPQSSNKNAADSQSKSAENPNEAASKVHSPSGSTLTVSLLVAGNTSFDVSEHLDSHETSSTYVDNNAHIDSKEAAPSIQKLDQELVLSDLKDNTISSLDAHIDSKESVPSIQKLDQELILSDLKDNTTSSLDAPIDSKESIRSIQKLDQELVLSDLKDNTISSLDAHIDSKESIPCIQKLDQELVLSDMKDNVTSSLDADTESKASIPSIQKLDQELILSDLKDNTTSSLDAHIDSKESIPSIQKLDQELVLSDMKENSTSSLDAHIDSKESVPSIQKLDQELVLSDMKDNSTSSLDAHIDSKESVPSIQKLDQELVLSDLKDNATSSLDVQKPDQFMETDSIDTIGNPLHFQPSDKVMETISREVTDSLVNAQVSDPVMDTNSHVITNSSLNIQSSDQGMETSSQSITDNSLDIQVMESNSHAVIDSPLDVQAADNVMETDSQDIPDNSFDIQPPDQFMETDSPSVPDGLLNVQASEQIMETDSQDVPDNFLNIQAPDQVMDIDSKEATDSSLVVQVPDQVMETDYKEARNNSLIAQDSEQMMETDSKEVTDSSLIIQASDQAMETDSQDATESSLRIQASDQVFSDVHLDQSNFPLLTNAKNSSCGPDLEIPTDQPFTSFGNDSVQNTTTIPSGAQASSQEQTFLVHVENSTENSSENPVDIVTPDSSTAALPTITENVGNDVGEQSLSTDQLNETQNSLIHLENPPNADGESFNDQTSTHDSPYLLTNIANNSEIAVENSLNNDSVMIAIVTLPDGSQRICQLSQAHGVSMNGTEMSQCSTVEESNSMLVSSESANSLTENTNQNSGSDPSVTVQALNESSVTSVLEESEQVQAERSVNVKPVSPSLVPLSVLVESALQNENEKTVVQSQKILQAPSTVPKTNTVSNTTESILYEAQNTSDAISIATPKNILTVTTQALSNIESSRHELQNCEENRLQENIDVSLNHQKDCSSQDHLIHSSSEVESCKMDIVATNSSFLHCASNGEDGNDSSNDQSLSSIENQGKSVDGGSNMCLSASKAKLPKAKKPPLMVATRFSKRNRKNTAAAVAFRHNCSNSTNNSKGRKKPKQHSNFPSVRSFFNEEYCYLMNAETCGNIGRYLNHSCNPNCFVQSVFVDTHDLRFPWVAFFALRHISAGSELTWDYNYSVGSVPGKILYCHCASKKCRGRLI